MNTILLAIDESTYSQAALDELIAHMRPESTQVHVLHVLELEHMLSIAYDFARGADYGHDAAAHVRTAHEAAQRLVGQAAGRLEAAGFSTTAVVREGEPRQGILSYAAECGSSCIVMGSHGRRGIDRFFMGSVSDTVSRHAPCSVYVGRSSPRPAATVA